MHIEEDVSNSLRLRCELADIDKQFVRDMMNHRAATASGSSLALTN